MTVPAARINPTQVTQVSILRTIWGNGDGRGISGFAVNRGAVNLGFTVLEREQIYLLLFDNQI